MSAEIPANVETTEKQREIIHRTTDLKGYQEYRDSHFLDFTWREEIAKRISRSSRAGNTPEYFRLLTLVGTLCSQYGFVSLDGQITRHRQKGWKKPVTSARHQLATASYAGYLNEQVYPIKEELAERTARECEEKGLNPQVSYGAWGVFYRPRAGKVIIPDGKTPIGFAIGRFYDQKPISLPNRKLNSGLADLQFTGDDADKMTNHNFEEEIFPQVVEIMEGFLDPIGAFIEERVRRFPFRFFSFRVR